MARPTAEMTAAAYDARSIFDVRPQVPSDDVVQDSITTQRSFERGELRRALESGSYKAMAINPHNFY